MKISENALTNFPKNWKLRKNVLSNLPKINNFEKCVDKYTKILKNLKTYWQIYQKIKNIEIHADKFFKKLKIT